MQGVGYEPLRGLGVERRALAHAEAMLLVHHHDRELAELDRLLDQGMGAHHQLQLAAGQAPEQLAAPSRRRGAGEQLDGERAAQQGVERAVVLLGQGLGGRHQRRLGAVLHRAQHRRHGHDGLAGPHLAHQQPLHGALARQVGVDLGHGPLLVAGELEGQRPAPPVDHHPARRQRARPPALAPGPAAAGHRELQQEELLEGEAPPCRLLVFLTVGEMHRRERGGALGQPLGRSQAPRQRIDHVEHTAVVVPHQLTNPCRRDAFGGRVHRHEAHGVHGNVRAAQQLVLGDPELPSAAQLAVEQHRGPLAQLARDPGLSPPHRQQRAALVEDTRLHALAAPVARGLDRHAAHRHPHGGLLPQPEVGHAAHVAAVAVRVRKMFEQVAYARDAERGERLARGSGQRHGLGQRLGMRERAQRHLSELIGDSVLRRLRSAWACPG